MARATAPGIFAESLRRHRARAGLTQEDLAEKAGLSVRAISDLERGLKQRPRATTLQLLSDALGIPEEERPAFEAAARRAGAPDAPSTGVRLPAQLTSFIGRERQVDAVCGMLLRPDVRLLTLMGPGGTGKTRLALRVAERVTDHFPHGVYFADLAAIADADLALQEIASALGVSESPDRPLLEGLEAYLGDREALVLLDNFEHVVIAAPQVSRLLIACRGLKVLATSRVTMRMSGEHVYPVPPLEIPEPPATTEELRRSEAVRLFLSRAQGAEPGFALTEGNTATVAEICRRLDGLPLAIELAAARVRALSPESILARLGDRFGLLVGGPQNLPARQQTLRAALDWSYELLSPAERGLLEQVSVFLSGMTLEAAEAVCTAPGHTAVLDGVSSLLDKSLLRREEALGDEPRFEMLETVREYALAKLEESGEDTAVHRRHAAYYLAFVNLATSELAGPRQDRWLRRLDEEMDNVRAALRWSRDSERAEHGLRMATALVGYWHLRGRLTEGRGWLDELLSVQDCAPPRATPAVCGRAMTAAAALASIQGDLAEAERLAVEGLALARECGDRQGIAAALHALGKVAHQRGDSERASALYEEGLGLYRELGDRADIASVLGDLGVLARDLGDWGRAYALHEESLALRRELGGPSAIAHSLHNLGLVAHLQGDYQQAESRLTEGLLLLRELGDVPGVADSLNHIGRLPHVRRDWMRATGLFEEALDFYREIGDEEGVASTLNNLGLVAYDRGEYERAIHLHEESCSIHAALGTRLGSGIGRYDLGNALYGVCEHGRAGEAYQEALRLLLGAGDKALIAFCLEGLGRVALAEGQPERAIRLWGAADKLRSAIQAPLPPPDRPLHERTAAHARGALGESAFQAAWEAGQRMTLEEAVRDALSEQA